MKVNLKTIIMVLALSSLVEGLFSFITPFYLASRGISFFNIGLIFSISALIMVLLRVFFGAYTDVKGRKTLFASSFLAQTISNMFFPFIYSVFDAIPIKILYDLGSSVRISLRSTMIFENARETYHRVIAWISGMEHLAMACINFFAASILSFLTFGGSYIFMATLQLAAFLVVLLIYKEKNKIQKSSKISLKDTYSLNLKRNMWVLMFTSAFSAIGVRLSHGFAEPLFWEGKFALSKGQIGLVIGLHRLSLAIPLFVTGTLMHRLDVKKAYALSNLILTILLTVMGFIDNVYIAVPIWLLHDIFGGSIQIPSGQILTQLNARDRSRGKDTNTIQLFSGVVGIIAPSLAGALITINWNLIFIVGGFLTFIGSLIFYLFYK